MVLTDRTVLVQMPEPGRYERWQWWLLPLLVALGAALFAVGGMAWLTALAVASAAVGRISPDGRATVIGLVCCTGIAVTISAATGSAMAIHWSPVPWSRWATCWRTARNAATC